RVSSASSAAPAPAASSWHRAPTPAQAATPSPASSRMPRARSASGPGGSRSSTRSSGGFGWGAVIIPSPARAGPPFAGGRGRPRPVHHYRGPRRSPARDNGVSRIRASPRARAAPDLHSCPSRTLHEQNRGPAKEAISMRKRRRLEKDSTANAAELAGLVRRGGGPPRGGPGTPRV